MEKIVSKVEKQEIEILYIKKTLDEIVEQNKKQSEQLTKISESITKQEVILEKISNLEEKYQDGIKRVHKRIDGELLACEKGKKDCENNLSKLENEIEKLKDEVKNRPCVSHNVVQTELNHIKEKIEKHGKIFWWLGTVVLGIVIVAVVKNILK